MRRRFSCAPASASGSPTARAPASSQAITPIDSAAETIAIGQKSGPAGRAANAP